MGTPLTISSSGEDESLTAAPSISLEKDNSEWIFQESLCGVACWRNIIMGETTTDELTLYLRGDNTITSVDEMSNLGFIEWEYQHGVRVRADLNRDREELPVAELTIYMSHYETVQEIIDYIGEPSHIAIVAEPAPDMTSIKPTMLYRIYFIYLDQGIALHYLRTQAPDQANITKTSLIDQVIIVESNVNSFMTYLRIHDPNSLLMWSGDNTLIYYCNLAYSNSEFCN